jgi:hypothetical protein
MDCFKLYISRISFNPCQITSISLRYNPILTFESPLHHRIASVEKTSLCPPPSGWLKSQGYKGQPRVKPLSKKDRINMVGSNEERLTDFQGASRPYCEYGLLAIGCGTIKIVDDI